MPLFLYLARLPAAVAATLSTACVTLAAILMNGLIWHWLGRPYDLMTLINPLLIGPTVAFVPFWGVFSVLTRQRRQAGSARRGYTNLQTKYSFTRLAQREAADALRAGDSIAVVAIVVQDAEPLITEWGRDPYEDILLELHSRISRCLRARDFIGRHGHQHFVAVLPQTDAGDAARVAESIRHACNTPFGLDYTQVPVRITTGCAAKIPEAGDDVIGRLTGQALLNMTEVQSGPARTPSSGRLSPLTAGDVNICLHGEPN